MVLHNKNTQHFIANKFIIVSISHSYLYIFSLFCDSWTPPWLHQYYLYNSRNMRYFDFFCTRKELFPDIISYNVGLNLHQSGIWKSGCVNLCVRKIIYPFWTPLKLKHGRLTVRNNILKVIYREASDLIPIFIFQQYYLVLLLFFCWNWFGCTRIDRFMTMVTRLSFVQL